MSCLCDSDENIEWGGYYWRLHGSYRVVEEYLYGTVLDLGCGAGYLAARCKPNSAVYTGVDLSERALAVARKLFGASKFVQHDVERPLPFDDRTYDTVIASHVLEHLQDPESCVREAARVSRRYLVLAVPIDMPAPAHLWPTWDWEVLRSLVPFTFKVLELREFPVRNFLLLHAERC